MEEIGGVGIEELKQAGLSNEDIVFNRETALAYKQKISEPGAVTATHDPPSVIDMSYIAFQWGVAVGIANAKKLKKVQKRIGF